MKGGSFSSIFTAIGTAIVPYVFYKTLKHKARKKRKTYKKKQMKTKKNRVPKKSKTKKK